jgi:hypothetical protein
MEKFAVDVSYRQLAVFVAGVDGPLNDWTAQHTAQGFSWRPGSVSFATLHESGRYDVELEVVKAAEIENRSRRAISVPFVIPPKSTIEVGSVTEGTVLQLRAGTYQLVFQELSDRKRKLCRLAFVRDGDQQPAILIADKALKPLFPLLMSAEPA